MLLHGHDRAARRSATSRRDSAPGRPRRSLALRRACAVAAAAALPVLAWLRGRDQRTSAEQWHPPAYRRRVQDRRTAGRERLGGHPRNEVRCSGAARHCAARWQLGLLFLALINTGPHDRLVRVSAPGTATSVTLLAGEPAPGRQRTADRAGSPRSS